MGKSFLLLIFLILCIKSLVNASTFKVLENNRRTIETSISKPFLKEGGTENESVWKDGSIAVELLYSREIGQFFGLNAFSGYSNYKRKINPNLVLGISPDTLLQFSYYGLGISFRKRLFTTLTAKLSFNLGVMHEFYKGGEFPERDKENLIYKSFFYKINYSVLTKVYKKISVGPHFYLKRRRVFENVSLPVNSDIEPELLYLYGIGLVIQVKII